MGLIVSARFEIDFINQPRPAWFCNPLMENPWGGGNVTRASSASPPDHVHMFG